MLESGDRLEIPDAAYPPADKHSTGGVGDKISFLVAPLVAAAGVPVPMISGRSLGHTGGTLDKLESIPGFRTQLAPEEIRRQIGAIGLCIAGQSERLAPADRIFYALRDAASIVESVPLITASILSKKAAVGVRALALDVKVGEGAFMADATRARILARSLVETAGRLGIRARAHLTAMDLVLGRTAGNALEIRETAEALRAGTAASDLRVLTLALGASMCLLAGRVASEAEGELLLDGLWSGGEGFETFQRMIVAQGGDARCLDDPGRLPRAQSTLEVAAPRSGRLIGVRARSAGDWIAEAGGGRLRAGDRVDPGVGLEVLAERGDSLRAGDPVLRLHLPGGFPDSGAQVEALRARAAEWIAVGGDDGFQSQELLLASVDEDSTDAGRPAATGSRGARDGADDAGGPTGAV
jgi:pyrimidine-nucleoside phosphorylase